MTFKQQLMFMIDNDINEKEYVLLLSMYYMNLDEDIPKLVTKFAKKWGVILNLKQTMFPIEVKEKLVPKGYLEKVGEKYALTDKFLDLFVGEFIAGQELIEEYPSFAVINNSNIPLKTESRMLLRELYWKTINGVRIEHEEVMKDVQYGIQQNLINQNIRKFIESEFWRDIRKLRLESITTTTIADDF